MNLLRSQVDFTGNYTLVMPNGEEVLVNSQIGKASPEAMSAVILDLMLDEYCRDLSLDNRFSLGYYQEIVRKGVQLSPGEEKALLVWHALTQGCLGSV